MAAGTGHAITVADLNGRLAHKDKITIVDVRMTSLFAQGHIVGAVNIPAALCPAKHLPPLGEVVVYSDGLIGDASSAAAALNAKPGIKADVLEGGFAAWQTANGLTTRPHGLTKERPNYITYAQLKAAKGSDIVLVDLRKQSHAKADKPLTDLSTEFPGLRQAQSPFSVKGSVGAAPLLVLIDQGDGTSEKMARILKNGGVKRYTILAGGDLILSRHGKKGLDRNGFSMAAPTVTRISGTSNK
jgi:rhodanese-related sulfurtransferase